MDFPGGSDGKASAFNVGDLGSMPRSGRSPGEGNDNPLQYSCLENSTDGGAWWATVHGVANSWTQLRDFTHSGTICINASNSYVKFETCKRICCLGILPMKQIYTEMHAMISMEFRITILC